MEENIETFDVTKHWRNTNTFDGKHKIFQCIHCLVNKNFDTERCTNHIKSVCMGLIEKNKLATARQFLINMDKVNACKKRKANQLLANEAQKNMVNALPKLITSNRKANADDAILEWLVMTKTPPSIIEDPSFHNMLAAVATAGPPYKTSNKKLFGLNNPKEHDQQAAPVLGDILKRNLDLALSFKAASLDGVSHTGGTLVSDGAKNRVSF